MTFVEIVRQPERATPEERDLIERARRLPDLPYERRYPRCCGVPMAASPVQARYECAQCGFSVTEQEREHLATYGQETLAQQVARLRREAELARMRRFRESEPLPPENRLAKRPAFLPPYRPS